MIPQLHELGPSFMIAAHNLDGKTFTALFNSANGQVNQETIFSYHQVDDHVWAHYANGPIIVGVIIGHFIEPNILQIYYQHYDHGHTRRSGSCVTTIQEVDGKIRLHEEWVWDDDGSDGTSVLVEV